MSDLSEICRTCLNCLPSKSLVDLYRIISFDGMEMELRSILENCTKLRVCEIGFCYEFDYEILHFINILGEKGRKFPSHTIMYGLYYETKSCIHISKTMY